MWKWCKNVYSKKYHPLPYPSTQSPSRSTTQDLSCRKTASLFSGLPCVSVCKEKQIYISSFLTQKVACCRLSEAFEVPKSHPSSKSCIIAYYLSILLMRKLRLLKAPHAYCCKPLHHVDKWPGFGAFYFGWSGFICPRSQNMQVGVFSL